VCDPGGAAIVAVSFLAWTLTGVYTVQAYQEAVITRFGGYARSVGRGLHYHLPSPSSGRTGIGDQPEQDVVGGVPARATDESLMLTGDENIVDLAFTVQWHVATPAAYLFKVRERTPR